ncbi:MAG: tRNA (adenosine(37)-N6)-dimethylallyltransferase MiaA [Desulfobacteraceae bacterium]|nr:tRNA (adenosine(37)-N6)-dimethylallyltransferase MiaA [Desulfobacteraceae bacterium]
MTRSAASSKEPETGGAPPTLILLAGPTASGKTALSLELARRLSAEIVNADSMQVYRFMDIGTAKPTPEERALIAHHLIDVADPDSDFDAARYLELARPAVEDLHRRGKVPLVVGGTGLYMKILTRGICPGPASDLAIRERLIVDEAERGLPQLYADLERIDPESALRIHPNDRQRILRALEFFLLTGVPLSLSQARHGFSDALFPAVKIFIHRDREELYGRIDRRVEAMLEAGFKSEVEHLLDLGFGPELKSMQSLGYRQMVGHIRGDLTLDRAVYLIKRDTRRYAKRQITWFKADPEFRFFHAGDVESIFSHIAGGLRREGN